jgi:hypothetical protein
MKTCSCKFCGSEFLASRSDAIRCKACRKTYLSDRNKLPETRKRRAEQHREIREKLFTGYGGKCVCCGENRFEFLALDHVNGGGNKERKTLSTAQIASRAIKDGFPDKFRVLCHNCNCSHGWYGYCPHEKETA